MNLAEFLQVREGALVACEGAWGELAAPAVGEVGSDQVADRDPRGLGRIWVPHPFDLADSAVPVRRLQRFADAFPIQHSLAGDRALAACPPATLRPMGAILSVPAPQMHFRRAHRSAAYSLPCAGVNSTNVRFEDFPAHYSGTLLRVPHKLLERLSEEWGGWWDSVFSDPQKILSFYFSIGLIRPGGTHRTGEHPSGTILCRHPLALNHSP